VHETLDFPDLLRLIDERSAAFRAAIAAAPDLGVRVPTCPDWTLFDLVQHIGAGRRAWAATVAAGLGATAKAAVPPSEATAPPEREAQLVWLAESTRLMLEALREAGPERGCWTWWRTSQSPQTCGAVARHQLHEIAVHTYDAQLAAGAPQPLPREVALDGVEEFLQTISTTTEPWPHRPAIVDYHVSEGRSWRNWLSADGARLARLSPGDRNDRDGRDGRAAEEEAADVSVEGPAQDMLLTFYGRAPLDVLKLDGDRAVYDRLVAWDPEQ